MSDYPRTKEEYSQLKKNGKTVVYAETDSKDIKPEGTDWDFWSTLETDTENKAVWRKIVTLEEAKKLTQ